MATLRTNILRGPGTVKLGDLALFDASGITADVESATQEVPSSISGTLDVIKTDQVGKVTFTPCGQITDDILAALFPHQNPTIGASVFGTQDTACAVHSLAGTKVTFVNCAVTKLPEIYLSPVKTAFGSVEITALLGLGKKPEDANAFYTVGSETYSAGSPDPTGIVGVPYTATYGQLAIDDTLDGWTVTPELQLEPVTTDALGTIDYTLTGVGVTATCTPLGLTESQILAALPIARARGASMRGASDLVITGAGGLTVTLKNATLERGPLQYGSTQLRAGQLQFRAQRAFTGGVAGAVWSVEMAAAAGS